MKPTIIDLFVSLWFKIEQKGMFNESMFKIGKNVLSEVVIMWTEIDAFLISSKKVLTMISITN